MKIAIPKKSPVFFATEKTHLSFIDPKNPFCPKFQTQKILQIPPPPPLTLPVKAPRKTLLFAPTVVDHQKKIKPHSTRAKNMVVH